MRLAFENMTDDQYELLTDRLETIVAILRDISNNTRLTMISTGDIEANTRR